MNKADERIINFYLSFADAFIRKDANRWEIESPGHTEEFNSYAEMLEEIRLTVREWIKEGYIIINIDTNGDITYTSLID